MHRRRLKCSFFALGCFLAATNALGQEASPANSQPDVTVLEDGTVSENVTYGTTVGLLYGIGYAGMAGGLWMIQPERGYLVRISGAIVLPSGGITTLFGPMITHFDHGFLGKGLLSAGGQLAALAVGGGGGYAVAKIAGADETRTAVLIGAASAHISWALFDIFYLAREERILERTTPAPSYSLALEAGGFRAGVRFQF